MESESEVQRDYSGYLSGARQGVAVGPGLDTKAGSYEADHRRRALTVVLRANDQGISLDQLQAAIDLVRTHIGE